MLRIQLIIKKYLFHTEFAAYLSSKSMSNDISNICLNNCFDLSLLPDI